MGSELKALIGSRELLRERRIRALSVVLSGYWLAEHGTSIEEVWDLIVSHGFVEARGRDVPRTPPL
jgi:hypothetical protein